MPIYEYECRSCGHRFEKLQKIDAPKVRTCPECKGRVDRLVSAPAIQFKGSGWYVTDYSDKGKEAAQAAKAEKGDDGGKTKEPDKKHPATKEGSGQQASAKDAGGKKEPAAKKAAKPKKD